MKHKKDPFALMSVLVGVVILLVGLFSGSEDKIQLLVGFAFLINGSCLQTLTSVIEILDKLKKG